MAVVGRIARPHGIRGQVIVNPETDFPEERFAVGATLFVRRGGGNIEPLTIASSRIQQGRPVIGIDGVGGMNEAQALAGLEFRVPVEDLAELPEGTFYHHDLVGCVVVTPDGVELGTVGAVEGEAGNTRLAVQTGTGELLIPLASEICTRIDPAARRIVVVPPDGLLGLNDRR
jgi:16S rRNA processing protein RimM